MGDPSGSESVRTEKPLRTSIPWPEGALYRNTVGPPPRIWSPEQYTLAKSFLDRRRMRETATWTLPTDGRNTQFVAEEPEQNTLTWLTTASSQAILRTNLTGNTRFLTYGRRCGGELASRKPGDVQAAWKKTVSDLWLANQLPITRWHPQRDEHDEQHSQSQQQSAGPTAESYNRSGEECPRSDTVNLSAVNLSVVNKSDKLGNKNLGYHQVISKSSVNRISDMPPYIDPDMTMAEPRVEPFVGIVGTAPGSAEADRENADPPLVVITSVPAQVSQFYQTITTSAPTFLPSEQTAAMCVPDPSAEVDGLFGSLVDRMQSLELAMEALVTRLAAAQSFTPVSLPPQGSQNNVILNTPLTAPTTTTTIHTAPRMSSGINNTVPYPGEQRGDTPMLPQVGVKTESGPEDTLGQDPIRQLQDLITQRNATPGHEGSHSRELYPPPGNYDPCVEDFSDYLARLGQYYTSKYNAATLDDVFRALRSYLTGELRSHYDDLSGESGCGAQEALHELCQYAQRIRTARKNIHWRPEDVSIKAAESYASFGRRLIRAFRTARPREDPECSESLKSRFLSVIPPCYTVEVRMALTADAKTADLTAAGLSDVIRVVDRAMAGHEALNRYLGSEPVATVQYSTPARVSRLIPEEEFEPEPRNRHPEFEDIEPTPLLDVPISPSEFQKGSHERAPFRPRSPTRSRGGWRGGRTENTVSSRNATRSNSHQARNLRSSWASQMRPTGNTRQDRSPSSNTKTDKAPFRCWYCGKEGHGFFRCPEECKRCHKTRHPGRTCDGTQSACFLCGKPGHMMRECPLNH